MLIALVEQEPDGGARVLAPTVGRWSDVPRAGKLLSPGSPIGTLQRLRRRFRLVLPDDATGRVDGSVTGHGAVTLEYGQLLFRLRPAGAGTEIATERRPESAGPGLPEGAYAVVSPTDGVFYRCPGPDTPPFVEVGRRVRRGDPVGLVEVMKTFNQILYGGPELPVEAEVIEVRCGDAQEVSAGEVLVVVRPVP